jgi:Xaa-Pro aminopeptidase
VSGTRADRLVELLVERELDALLVTNLVNVRYLTGFTGTNGLCIVGPEIRLFLTDFRYVERAETEVRDFDRARGKQDLIGDAAEHLSRGAGDARRVGFEDDHLTVRRHQQLAKAVSDVVELIAAGGLAERLRAVKEPGELAAIRDAAALTDQVLKRLAERPLAGRTEREVALELEGEIRAQGAEGPAFPPIVAAGPHGALPHADPREVEIEPGTLVIVDVGSVVDGYSSDCTRTFATGPLDDGAAEVYELVLGAQERALEAARPGAGCREVDAVAREPIEAAGHGERFGHGLGHGVGLEVHEGPRLAPTADCELEAGNVVTIEPGVYVSGEYGVRIEDLVTVTEAGCEVLTGFPKSLTIPGS